MASTIAEEGRVVAICAGTFDIRKEIAVCVLNGFCDVLTRFISSTDSSKWENSCNYFSFFVITKYMKLFR